MHEVLVNRLGGLSLPRTSVVRLIDRPDMTLDVYRGRKTTMQQQQHFVNRLCSDHKGNDAGDSIGRILLEFVNSGFFPSKHSWKSSRMLLKTTCSCF